MISLKKLVIFIGCLFLCNISQAQHFKGFVFQIFYISKGSDIVYDSEPLDRFFLDSSNFNTANFETFKLPTMTRHYSKGFNDELNTMLSNRLHVIPYNAKRFLFVDDRCYSKYARYLNSKVNTGKSINLVIDSSLTIRICVNKVEFEGCNLKQSIYDEGFLNMIAIGSIVKDLEFSESELLAFQSFSKILLDSLLSK